MFLTYTPGLFIVKSYGRNPIKDMLVIQEQISETEQCLVKDEENIVSALNDNNLDLAKTHLTKHSFFI